MDRPSSTRAAFPETNGGVREHERPFRERVGWVMPVAIALTQVAATILIQRGA